MNRIYTIGFAEKSAKQFFSLLKGSTGTHLLDIRLNDVSQLAAFTKRDDLAFFLDAILHWPYKHLVNLAPTKSILDDYKAKKISWQDYEKQYLELLATRQIERDFSKDNINGAVLLCSEHLPSFCHRRLAAEYLRSKLGNEIEIIHLK